MRNKGKRWAHKSESVKKGISQKPTSYKEFRNMMFEGQQYWYIPSPIIPL